MGHSLNRESIKLTRGVAMLVMAVVVGCSMSDTAERRAVAASAVREYLAALSNGAGDLGWSYIDDEMGWAGHDAYRAAMQGLGDAVDGIEVTEAYRCDEGYACRVCLRVEDLNQVPDELRSSDGRAFDGIIALADPLPCGNAIIGVGLDPSSGHLDGIWIGP